MAVVAALLTAPADPAKAAPDHEESIGELEKKLTKATRAYNNAEGRLQASRKKQKKFDKEIKKLQTKADVLADKVGEMSAAVYRGTQASTINALLESGSPEELAHGMTTVSYLASRDLRKIRAFSQVRDDLAKKQYQAELEIRKQRSELKKMKKRKKEALAALIKAGGGDPTSGYYTGGGSAAPAPRAADGSWPPESCSQDDPTTDGCITPRTLHAYQQARNAGYTRYTACFRNASSGEHGKGRACDMAAFPDGFRNESAYGSHKTYGDNLAGWFISNSSRLGVMYVIWYRRIWMPGSGWSTYSGGGSPAGDHTNHVHVSIQ